MKLKHPKQFFRVDSSVIQALGYVPTSGNLGNLFVYFNNERLYVYSYVEFDTFLELLNSSSVGTYYNDFIEPNYNSQEITSSLQTQYIPIVDYNENYFPIAKKDSNLLVFDLIDKEIDATHDELIEVKHQIDELEKKEISLQNKVEKLQKAREALS